MVRVPKSSKGKMKRQLFQPLMVLNLEFDYRPKSNLQRLRDVSIQIPFLISLFLHTNLAFPCSCQNCFHMLPVMSKLMVRSIFSIQDSIEWLDHAKGAIANFHIVFMIQLSFHLGFMPNIESGMSGDYFDLVDGCFAAHVPSHVHYLNKEDSMRLVSLFRLDYKTMHLYTMSRIERNRCVEVILEYYKLHLPDFPEMKSFSVLQELFA